jgi:ssDNA-binding Zn-finger/Zn-ribbon topoisomerase 1
MSEIENSTGKKEASGLAESVETPGVPDSAEGAEALRTVNTDETVVIPATMKLRLEKCPKCHYERQDGDEAFATPFECPKCGVVYALAMEEVRKQGRGHELQAEAEAEEMRRLAQAQNENIRSSQIGSAMFVGEEKSNIWIAVVILAILAVVGALFFI